MNAPFSLSIFTGSLIHEHYTRECEFGNFDKIKNKNNTQKNTQETQKLWYKVCLFDFILNVRSTIFQLNRDGSSWVQPVLS